MKPLRIHLSSRNFRLSSFHSSGVSWLYPFTAMYRSAFSISDFRTICLPNMVNCSHSPFSFLVYVRQLTHHRQLSISLRFFHCRMCLRLENFRVIVLGIGVITSISSLNFISISSSFIECPKSFLQVWRVWRTRTFFCLDPSVRLRYGTLPYRRLSRTGRARSGKFSC